MQGLQVCSNDDPRMTSVLFTAQSISVLVAVAILEEFCMASADMQWPICSGERIVAHGLLVFLVVFFT